MKVYFYDKIIKNWWVRGEDKPYFLLPETPFIEAGGNWNEIGITNLVITKQNLTFFDQQDIKNNYFKVDWEDGTISYFYFIEQSDILNNTDNKNYCQKVFLLDAWLSYQLKLLNYLSTLEVINPIKIDMGHYSRYSLINGERRIDYVKAPWHNQSYLTYEKRKEYENNIITLPDKARNVKIAAFYNSLAKKKVGYSESYPTHWYDYPPEFNGDLAETDFTLTGCSVIIENADRKYGIKPTQLAWSFTLTIHKADTVLITKRVLKYSYSIQNSWGGSSGQVYITADTHEIPGIPYPITLTETYGYIRGGNWGQTMPSAPLKFERGTYSSVSVAALIVRTQGTKGAEIGTISNVEIANFIAPSGQQTDYDYVRFRVNINHGSTQDFNLAWNTWEVSITVNLNKEVGVYDYTFSDSGKETKQVIYNNWEIDSDDNPIKIEYFDEAFRQADGTYLYAIFKSSCLLDEDDKPLTFQLIGGVSKDYPPNSYFIVPIKPQLLDSELTLIEFSNLYKTALSSGNFLGVKRTNIKPSLLGCAYWNKNILPYAFNYCEPDFSGWVCWDNSATPDLFKIGLMVGDEAGELGYIDSTNYERFRQLEDLKEAMKDNKNKPLILLENEPFYFNTSNFRFRFWNMNEWIGLDFIDEINFSWELKIFFNNEINYFANVGIPYFKNAIFDYNNFTWNEIKNGDYFTTAQADYYASNIRTEKTSEESFKAERALSREQYYENMAFNTAETLAIGSANIAGESAKAANPVAQVLGVAGNPGKAALQMGFDLGRIALNAKQFERQNQLESFQFYKNMQTNQVNRQRTPPQLVSSFDLGKLGVSDNAIYFELTIKEDLERELYNIQKNGYCLNMWVDDIRELFLTGGEFRREKFNFYKINEQTLNTLIYKYYSQDDLINQVGPAYSHYSYWADFLSLFNGIRIHWNGELNNYYDAENLETYA